MNRLAVVLVQEEENKILDITKTSNSTGKVKAEKVKEIIDNWSVTEKIIACRFDTTAANTGLHKGACTILQQLLQRQILWMACRHHILEHLFGETDSPEVTDCMSDKEDLLSFINNMLELKNQPRVPGAGKSNGYERNNGYEFQIQRPGADHHIYLMKMTLLSVLLKLLAAGANFFDFYHFSSAYK